VERWVKPEEFIELREEAEEIGFAGVMSGPLVRSSYRAGRLYEMALLRRDDTALLRRDDTALLRRDDTALLRRDEVTAGHTVDR